MPHHFELEKSRRSTIRKFFEGLEKNQRARIGALLNWIAENGKPKDVRKFAAEEEGIFAIKDFQVRIYCFLGKDNSIIITNGAIKKADKANPEDLKRAKRLRNEYERNMA